MEFISGSEKSFNTIHSNDFSFYEELDATIQREPLDFIGAETRGLFASIGIEKGKPFAPDKRRKEILTDSVAIGNATARSIVWYPRVAGTLKGIEIYPDTGSAWLMAYTVSVPQNHYCQLVYDEDFSRGFSNRSQRCHVDQIRRR